MIALGLQKLKESSIECFPLLLTKRKAGRKRSVIPRRKHSVDSSCVRNNDFTGCCQMFFLFLRVFLLFMTILQGGVGLWCLKSVSTGLNWMIFKVSFTCTYWVHNKPCLQTCIGSQCMHNEKWSTGVSTQCYYKLQVMMAQPRHWPRQLWFLFGWLDS